MVAISPPPLDQSDSGSPPVDTESNIEKHESHFEVASSVRVYNRVCHIVSSSQNGKSSLFGYVPIGAIGDVATRIEHRGKRLASKLMAMGDEYMISKVRLEQIYIYRYIMTT